MISSPSGVIARLLVMSISANVMSSAGAPAINPCARAWKTKVSLGQGEKAICIYITSVNVENAASNACKAS
ncbi:hypothetical protein, partial [Paenibacillus polymyxa]|uniref:hypothetical protein n=1 Tax=Paenibacillus polymyxa TaxID=1406 RepID=UPI001E4316B2